jgi:hypothetical protein
MESVSCIPNGRKADCIVGYALNAKKLRKSSPELPKGSPSSLNHKACAANLTHEWRGGGLADILVSAPCSCDDEHGRVKFVAWDHESNQPYCDVIIHKLTEDIDNPSKESVAKLAALNAYLAAHPRTVVVDPVSCVRSVVSRARTCLQLQSIIGALGEFAPFTQPAHVVIDKVLSTEDTLQEMKASGLHFPIICKPVQACGTPHSHSMVSIDCQRQQTTFRSS